MAEKLITARRFSDLTHVPAAEALARPDALTPSRDGRLLATSRPKTTSEDDHFGAVQEALEKKLGFRPSVSELEARNVLKSTRYRHSAIDFDEAASTLSVHLKQRAEAIKEGRGPPAPASGAAVLKSPSLPSGRLVEATPDKASELAPDSPLARRGTQHLSSDFSSASHRGRSDDEAGSPTRDATSLLREADFLTDRGYMTRDQNHAMLEALRVRDIAKAHSLVSDAARRMPRDQRDQLQAVKSSRRGTGRRNTIAVGMADAPSARPTSATCGRAKEENDDEDELRCITNTTLILERIRLENTLDSQLASHLVLALQYLTEAQKICQQRTTHIERRMHRKLGLGDGAQGEDEEIVKWIASEYMEREREVLPPRSDGLTLPAGNSPSTKRRTMRGTAPPGQNKSLRNMGQAAKGGGHRESVAGEMTAKVAELQALMRVPDVSDTLRLTMDWNFDVFRLDEVSSGRPLAALAFHLLSSSGIEERFRVPKTRIANFFNAVENGYVKTNPFHNHIHGTDVAQTTYFFLNTDAMRALLTPLDMFAALVSAFVHDLGHPGTTNAFQVATSSPLALRYNDQSVLENFHIASAFRLLQQEENDIFATLSREERNEMRESIIQMVLATDMRQHVHQVAELEGAIQNKRNRDVWFDRSNKDDRRMLLNMGLHAADLSNPCKPRYLYCLWLDRLMREFFAQGDQERSLGLPISPMMDRHKMQVEKSQVGFIEFIIRPLYPQWAHIIPEVSVCMKHLTANLEFFQQKVPRAKAVPSPTNKNAAAAAAAAQPPPQPLSASDSPSSPSIGPAAAAVPPSSSTASVGPTAQKMGSPSYASIARKGSSAGLAAAARSPPGPASSPSPVAAAPAPGSEDRRRRADQYIHKGNSTIR